MIGEDPARIIVLGPGEGRTITMGQNPDHMRLKAGAADTSRHFALLEYHAQPDSPGVPLHLHEGHDEGFYVLEGVLQMQLGQEVLDVQPGGFVFVPRGIAHRFGNPFPEFCRFLATFSPAGFEEFFDQRLRLLEQHGLDSQEVLDLARSHGVVYMDPPEQAAGQP